MTFKSFLSATGSAIGATAKIMGEVSMNNARGNLLLRLSEPIGKLEDAFKTLEPELTTISA